MNLTMLVARREIRERLKAKSFRISTVISILIVVAAIVIPAVQKDDKPTYDIALLEPPAMPAAGIEVLEGPLDVVLRVHSLATRPAAEAGLRQDTVDVVVAGPNEILVKRPLESGDAGKKAQVVAALSNLLRFQRLGPEAAAALQAPIAVRGVEPPRADLGDRFTAFFGVILLFMFLQIYGSWVLMGVIEEKASRVVEVLLAAISPRQLVGGKVLGIGAVAFAQGALAAIAAVITATAVGADIFEGSSRYVIAWTLGWFVLGYALYAWAFAAVGALASRQADAQNAAFPIMIPMLVGYLSVTPLLGGGDPSLFLRVLAFLPPTAPMVMPMLVGTGTAAVWHVLLSMGITIAAILLLMRAAGDIYSRAILHTGQSLKLKQVLRRDFTAA